MQKKEALMKRKAELEEAGLDAEEASATVADFEDADDDTFAKVVALMKKKADKHGDKEKEEEKAMKMKEEKAIKKEKEAKAEEELDSAEAGEEALEQVEPVEEVAIAELDEQEDPAESLRSVASEWLGSVLQTLPKQK